jgi:hypothetical protein
VTTTTQKPVHYKPRAFTNGTACGVQTRHGVQYSLRLDGVTCPRCHKEMTKPATTVDQALERVRAQYSLNNDPNATHALLEALNALVPTPKEAS